MTMNYNTPREFGKYTMAEFQFESGATLENVTVEYVTFGTLKYNENHELINTIIYCHAYDTDYTGVREIYNITNENDPLDENEYFFISINSLGFPDSCSPSSTGLKFKFPHYTLKDAVNFKRQFLKEKFGIEHVHGIIGREMGGYEVFTWACEYPDEMDFILVAGSGFKTSGHKYVLAKTIDNIIESSDYYNESYSSSISETLISLNVLIYPYHKSKQQLEDMTNDEIDIYMEDFVENRLTFDVYDIKYRNDALMNYDVEDKLKKIKAKSLIFRSKQDLYFSIEHDLLPLKELIKDCEIVLYESDELDFEYQNPAIVKNEITLFLKDITY